MSAYDGSQTIQEVKNQILREDRTKIAPSSDQEEESNVQH